MRSLSRLAWALRRRASSARGLSGEAAGALSETYRITGLLHDFDYEKYPSAEEHPFVGNKILAEQGWPEEIREAIMGHAQYSGVARIRISPRPSLPAMNWPVF
jgi:predicted hydrolase (HD superfamily)